MKEIYTISPLFNRVDFHWFPHIYSIETEVIISLTYLNFNYFVASLLNT